MVDVETERKRAVAIARARQAQAGATNGDGGASGEDILLGQIRNQLGQQPKAESAGGVGDFVRMVPQGMGENIPVVGPLVSRAADAVGSQIGAAITGGTPQEALDRASAMKAADRSTVAGQIGYGVGAGMGMVGPVAQAGAANPAIGRALGMNGSVPTRIMAGSASGAVLSGADAAARGGDAGEIGMQAAVGGGLGAAFPVVGAGLTAVRTAAAGKPLSSAESIVARALMDDQVPIDQLQSRLSDLGPGAVLADLGPNLQRQAGALASIPGEAQTVVRDALIARNLGTNSRIQGDVNAVLGPAPIPSRVAAENTANRRALDPAYRAVLDDATAVDTSDLALTLDSMAVNERGAGQAAARQVRDMLNVVGADELDPNPATLLNTRQAIDGLLNGETDGNVIRILRDARREVDGILTEAVPGIKSVDARYQELARQGEAFQTGQQVLDSGRTAMRPDDVASAMSNTDGASPLLVGPSGAPFMISQGARAEIDRLIGTTANNLTALKAALKGDGSWNRARLSSTFGEDRADALLNVLEREGAFQRTYNVVTQNSETAARAAAQAEVNAGTPANLQGLTMTGLLATGLQKAANAGAAWRQGGVNDRVAEALMAQRMDPGFNMAVQRAMTGMNAKPLAPASGALITQALMGQGGY